jgi:hypothetical protein
MRANGLTIVVKPLTRQIAILPIDPIDHSGVLVGAAPPTRSQLSFKRQIGNHAKPKLSATSPPIPLLANVYQASPF